MLGNIFAKDVLSASRLICSVDVLITTLAAGLYDAISSVTKFTSGNMRFPIVLQNGSLSTEVMLKLFVKSSLNPTQNQPASIHILCVLLSFSISRTISSFEISCELAKDDDIGIAASGNSLIIFTHSFKALTLIGINMDSQIEFLLARSYLYSIETSMPLFNKIDFDSIYNVCCNESSKFEKYHAYKTTPNARFGLPLITDEETGSFFPLHTVGRDEMDFQYHTEYMKKMPTIAQFLNKFKGGVGRTHALRFGPGGFFPPHRDGPNKDPFRETFRLFFAIKNCGTKNFAFIVDGKQLQIADNNVYFINTCLQHSAFCYGPDETFCIVSNVQINLANVLTLAELTGTDVVK